jgi:hypothetical protein
VRRLSRRVFDVFRFGTGIPYSSDKPLLREAYPFEQLEWGAKPFLGALATDGVSVDTAGGTKTLAPNHTVRLQRDRQQELITHHLGDIKRRLGVRVDVSGPFFELFGPFGCHFMGG